VIYFFKGMGRVGERLLATPPSEVALPAVVLYELEVGIAKSSHSKRRRGQLDQLLNAISILPFSQEEARASEGLRARLEKKGQPIGPLDTLIAGTALEAGATLVTRNVAEFGRITSLKTENWY
jgi:tRNA(fMet)-specific endonuclease VapC